MLKQKSLIFVIILILAHPVNFASGLNQGDYHNKIWAGGTHIWLHYPEEARPGDNIAFNVYIISDLNARGNEIQEVKIKISSLTSTSTQTLYEDTLLAYEYLDYGASRNFTIPINIPSDARWYLTIQVDAISYDFGMINRGEAHTILDSTQIRSTTYSSLQAQVQELLSYNAQLDEKYDNLQEQLNNVQTSTGSQLEEEYLNLLEEYLELSGTYNQQITEDVTTPDQDMINALQEMETKYMELQEDLESVSNTFGASIEEKDSIIHNLEETINTLEEGQVSLEKELNQINNEKDELNTEYYEYKSSHPVEQETINTYISNIVNLRLTRNILILTTLLGAAATIYLYINKPN
jgi:hypothetical protein